MFMQFFISFKMLCTCLRFFHAQISGFGHFRIWEYKIYFRLVIICLGCCLSSTNTQLVARLICWYSSRSRRKSERLPFWSPYFVEFMNQLSREYNFSSWNLKQMWSLAKKRMWFLLLKQMPMVHYAFSMSLLIIMWKCLRGEKIYLIWWCSSGASPLHHIYSLYCFINGYCHLYDFDLVLFSIPTVYSLDCLLSITCFFYILPSCLRLSLRIKKYSCAILQLWCREQQMCSGKIYELWHSKLTFSFMLNRLVQCVYLTRVNCVLWICSSGIGLI